MIAAYVPHLDAVMEFVLKLVKEEMTLASIVAFFYFDYYGVKKVLGN